MTKDETQRLSILHSKMQDAIHRSNTTMIDIIIMPWLKELYDILKPYREDSNGEERV